jgi:hypothetical protein
MTFSEVLEDIKDWWGDQKLAPENRDVEEQTMKLILKCASEYEEYIDMDGDWLPEYPDAFWDIKTTVGQNVRDTIAAAVDWVREANINYFSYLKGDLH